MKLPCCPGNKTNFFPFPALFQVSVKGDISLSILILRQFSNFIIKCELAACHCILHSLLCRASKEATRVPEPMFFR